MFAHCGSVNVIRIKATSHLVTLNHSAANLGILKRQQALVAAAGRSAAVDFFAKAIGRMPAQDISLDLRKYPVCEGDACPIFIIQDSNFASRVAPYQRPDRSEFKRFVTSYLAGSLVRRTDHEFFQIDNGETIKFPNPHEKEIRGYEFENMLRRAGMLRQDYWREKKNTQTWKRGCPRTPSMPPLKQ